MSEMNEVDLRNVRSWIYPTNYPVRDYQKDICQQALLNNTLVCLPTGLGKTLIAAVVIYNYYRWFPNGKILFMAPTRPLVNQQLNACTDIMNIPADEVTYLEGSISAEKRTALWRDHRIFFCTPQTAFNDLKGERFDGNSVVCVVIDEAHKSTGGYAYTTFMEELSRVHSSQQFRVLALSATPGTELRKIQEVVYNLKISQIEIRTEDDPDVAPYVHRKQIEIVKCDEALVPFHQQIKEETHRLMRKPLEELESHNLVICSEPQNLNRFVLPEIEENLHIYLTENPLTTSEFERPLKDNLLLLNILMECKRIFSSFDATAKNGSGKNKTGQKTSSSNGVGDLLTYLEQQMKLYNNVNYHYIHQSLSKLHSLAKKFQGNNFKNYAKQQPKINKLKEILLKHFQDFQSKDNTGSATRVIVFVHLRTTVMEVKNELSSLSASKEGRNLIKPKEFIGQGNSSSSSSSSENGSAGTHIGLTQAEQSQILKQFNSGVYNVLIATSIAEEGIDIAEVDLIVLLDSVASPTRLVQRCGRTGRKREGRIVIISAPAQANNGSSSQNNSSSSTNNPEVTEEDKFENSYKSIQMLNEILKRADRSIMLYPRNPRMIPAQLPLPEIEFRQMGKPQTGVVGSGAGSAVAGGGKDGNTNNNKKIANYFTAHENNSNREFIGIEDDDDQFDYVPQEVEEKEVMAGFSGFSAPPIPSFLAAEEEDDPFAAYFSNNPPASSGDDKHPKNVTVRKSARKTSVLRLSDPPPPLLMDVIDISLSQEEVNDCSGLLATNLSHNNSGAGFIDPLNLLNDPAGSFFTGETDSDRLSSSRFIAKKELDSLFRQCDNPDEFRYPPQQRREGGPREEEETDQPDSNYQEDYPPYQETEFLYDQYQEASSVSIRRESGTVLPETYQYPGATPIDVFSSSCGMAASSTEKDSQKKNKKASPGSALAGQSLPREEPELQARHGIASVVDEFGDFCSAVVIRKLAKMREDWENRRKLKGEKAADTEETQGPEEPSPSLPPAPRESKPSLARSSFLGKVIQGKSLSSKNQQLSLAPPPQEPPLSSTSSSSSSAPVAMTQHIQPNFDDQFSPPPFLGAETMMTGDQEEEEEEFSPSADGKSKKRKSEDTLSLSSPSSPSSRQKKPRREDRNQSSAAIIRRTTVGLPPRSAVPTALTERFCCVCLGRENHGDESKNKNRRESGRSSLLSDDEEEEEDDSSSNEEDDEPLIQCSGSCGSVFHRSCYDPSHDNDSNDDHDENNSRPFLCDHCSYQRKHPVSPPKTCGLCSQRNGLLKQSSVDPALWAHLSCVFFTPELFLEDGCSLPGHLLDLLNPERQNLLCRACLGRGGAVVQCQFTECFQAYHPQCVISSFLKKGKDCGQLVTWERQRGSRRSGGGGGESVCYDFYCTQHEHHLPATGLILSSLKPLSSTSSLSSAHPTITSSSPGPERITATQFELTNTDEKKQRKTADPLLIHRKKDSHNNNQLKRLKLLKQREAEKEEDQSGEEISEKEREKQRKLKQKQKNIYSKHFHNPALKNYFDLEAALSDGERGGEQEGVRKTVAGCFADQAEDDSSSPGEDSSEQLSGDFINDGAYTQPEEGTPGEATQLAMYYDLNRQLREEDSARLLDEEGGLRVEDLVLRKNHRCYRSGHLQNMDVFSTENTPFKGEEEKDKNNKNKKKEKERKRQDKKNNKSKRKSSLGSEGGEPGEYDEEEDEGEECNTGDEEEEEEEEEDLDAYDTSFVVEDDEVEYETGGEEEEDAELGAEDSQLLDQLRRARDQRHRSNSSLPRREQKKSNNHEEKKKNNSSSAAPISFPRSNPTTATLPSKQLSSYFKETDPAAANKIVNILDTSGEKDEEEVLVKKNQNQRKKKKKKSLKHLFRDEEEDEVEEVEEEETNKENHSQSQSQSHRKNNNSSSHHRKSLALSLVSSDEKKKPKKTPAQPTENRTGALQKKPRHSVIEILDDDEDEPW